jgi:hypothetical protein
MAKAMLEGGFIWLKNNMAKLKVRLSYGVIPNHVLRDKRLTAKSKGIFAYIQSKPDGWDFSAERIAEEMSDGRESIRTGLIELEGVGLLKRSQWKNKDTGTFEHGYELFETSTHYPESDSPTTGYPTSDIPTSENPTRNKEIESKKEEVININTETQVAIATTAKPYEEINTIISEIKEVCRSQGWAYDKTMDRKFAHHILTAKEFGEQAEATNLSRQEYAVKIIQASALLDFWAGKVTGPMAIYKHHSKIYNAAKEFKRTQAPQNQFQTI